MPKFIFNASQTRIQNWVVEVEADTEENAQETLLDGFDDDHGFFYEDTEGLTVLEDDGPISDFGPLKFYLTEKK